MYIFPNSVKTLNRGEKMQKRKLKPYVIPTLYGLAVILFITGLYLVGMLVNNIMFKDDKEKLQYVDGDIVEDRDYIPVINTEVEIARPYLSTDVTVYKSFYDYQGENDKQEDAILYYEGTYVQNSGIDYSSKTEFDVVSVLDGTVIDVKEDSVLGSTVEIRHDNKLISIYQCIKDVSVKIDDKIVQGQVIGKSGASNINLDSAHNLHFELYYQGKNVNPEQYYDKLLKDL